MGTPVLPPRKKRKQQTKKLRRPGIEPGSTAWKATMLTITPATLSMLITGGGCVHIATLGTQTVVVHPAGKAYSICNRPTHITVGYDHINCNPPVLIRTPKLTQFEPAQYWGGGPPGNTVYCKFSLLAVHSCQLPVLLAAKQSAARRTHRHLAVISG